MGRPHDPDYPDVDPDTGDEAATEPRMRGPVYERGFPQELREYIRISIRTEVRRRVHDALIGTGEFEPQGIALDMSRTNLIQTRTDD